MPEDRAASVLLAARDNALRDIERTMIQIIQASISMIGFGFTIHAFLDRADLTLSVDLDQVARRVGLALLSIGLLYLAWGVWNQLGYLRLIQRRHPLPPGLAAREAYSTRSTFTVAWLLLAVGLAAFAAMAVRAIG